MWSPPCTVYPMRATLRRLNCGAGGMAETPDPSDERREAPGTEPDAERRDRGQTLDELREALRARDEFIAVAAHELRNPMTPIGIRVHALLNAAREPGVDVPPRLIEGLEGLALAVDVFLRRAATLLQVSRLNADRIQLDPATVDLSALVRSTAERHRPMADFVRSELRLQVDDAVFGVLDRTAVEQVVDNLLGNALKYGAGAPVEVTLTSCSGVARLTVRDAGVGISAEDQARIFDRFERVMARGHRGGFGIGLWVARRLAEAMGGTIAVESAPGAGWAFTVTLPLQRPPDKRP